MSTGYAIAYRLGFTPWEKAGREAKDQFNVLLDREQEGDSPFGRALDIGCGTGEHTVNLAQRGWDVTGGDVIPRALEAARSKATEADVNARFLHADVTAMVDRVGGGYRFLLDVGCFHGLKPGLRPVYARQVGAVSEPGATMLMLAFQPGRGLRFPCPGERPVRRSRPPSGGGRSSVTTPPRPPACLRRSGAPHPASSGCAAVVDHRSPIVCRAGRYRAMETPGFRCACTA